LDRLVQKKNQGERRGIVMVITKKDNYIFARYSLSKLIFLTAILFCSILGCEEKSSTTVSKVTLAENPVPLSSVTIIAHEKQFFKKHGINLDVKPFTSGKLALDAVLGGAADFATVAETPLMLAGFADQPAIILATFTYSNNDTKVAARRDLGVNQPIDLKGKKVATFVGTSAEFFMNAFLKGYGLSSKDVEVVSLKPPEMVTALERGDVAAFFIWEPHIYNSRQILGDKIVIFSGRQFYTETYNLVTTKEYAQKNQEIVKEMLYALLDAEKFIHDHPDDAINIVTSFVGMDKSVLNKIWADFNFNVALDPFLLTCMNEQAQWALESGIVKKEKVPDYARMIYAAPLIQIKPEVVKIGKEQ
jgi:ABC-type nitrate/sulfonate/bicarbonate transport system substrate-binding protein